MHLNTITNADRGKNGIALILVLGILTLMTILAVSFSITMRTERLAAGNNTDLVRSRQLMSVARDRALDDLNFELGMWRSSMVTNPSPGNFVVSGGAVYRTGQKVMIDSTEELPNGLYEDTVYYVFLGFGGYNLAATLDDALNGVSVPVAGLGSGTITFRALKKEVQRATKVDSSVNRIYIPQPKAFAKNDEVFFRTTGTLPSFLDSNTPYTVVNDPAIAGFIDVGSLSSDGDGSLIVERFDAWETFENRNWYEFGYDEDTETFFTNTYNAMSVSRPIKTGTRLIYKGDGPIEPYQYCYSVYADEYCILLAPTYEDALCAHFTNGGVNSGSFYIDGTVFPVWTNSPSFYGTNNFAGGTLAVDTFTSSNLVNMIFPQNNIYTYKTGERVMLDSTDSLPGNLDANVEYYVIPKYTNNGLQLAISEANANAGIAVTFTSDGSGICSLRFIDKEVVQHVPDVMWDPATDVECYGLKRFWIPIYFKMSQNADPTLVGAYGYSALNCSGLIDINNVGADGVSRSLGLSPSELDIAYLPEVEDQKANILQKRDNDYIRYETVHEIQQLAGLKTYPSYLYPYSFCPPGYWNPEEGLETPTESEGFLAADVDADAGADTIDVDKVYQTGSRIDFDPAGPAPPNPLERGKPYYAIHVSDSQIKVAESLYDAAISNAVDLTSEVGATLRLKYGKICLDIDNPSDVTPITVRQGAIENAFSLSGFEDPIAGQVCYANLIDYFDTNSVPLNMSNSVEAVPMINEVVCSNSAWLDIVDGTNYYSITNVVVVELCYPFVVDPPLGREFVLSCGVGCRALSFPMDYSGASTSAPFSVSSRSFVNLMFTNSIHYVTNGAPLAGNLMCTTVVYQLETMLGDEIVDAFAEPLILTNSSPLGGGASVEVMECIDPRLNSRPDYSSEWVYGTNIPSLGMTNLVAVKYWSAVSGVDTGSEMYVRDGPMTSVGEMGYLMCSTNPWRTIKIYGPNAQYDVLDRFAVDADPPTRGLVNPNTDYRDVLATVFYSMPVDEYPGGPTLAGPLDRARAAIVAGQMMSKRPYMNTGEAYAFLNSFPVGGANELQRESFVRNSIQLLCARQNMFTILLRADSASSGQMAKNPVRETGVAIVWRDPYTGESFIKSYKALRD